MLLTVGILKRHVLRLYLGIIQCCQIIIAFSFRVFQPSVDLQGHHVLGAVRNEVDHVDSGLEYVGGTLEHVGRVLEDDIGGGLVEQCKRGS